MNPFQRSGVDYSTDMIGGKTPVPEESIKAAPPQLAAVEKQISTFGSDGYFLDACALCKTKIHEFQDRYMYGYLQAFCSIGCRDDRIALDEKSNPPSPIRCPNVSCSALGLGNSKAKKSRR